ncbi:NAD-dependent epimerase/dehydratase [Flagelloscypha sp. PMI_526]|nr:NAD-dependent epimerase/dehydratase [Flagelloscypha sp. PMI_526]
MKVFVTGGSGLVGSNVVEHLVAAGHTVTGLARSEASASKLTSLGATPTASAADAVIHCAFNHETFMKPNGMVQPNEEDRAAITAMCDALVSSGPGKTFINSSAILTNITDDEFSPIPEGPAGPRGPAEKLLLSYSERGVRTINVRLSPVHCAGYEQTFLAAMIGIAKKNGFVGYVGEGTNVWPAVHAKDAGALYVLGLTSEKVKSGSNLNAVAEAGIPTKEIVEFIAKKMGLEAKSIPPAEAQAHFGFLGFALQAGRKITTKYTREWTGWEPTGPGLFEDLETYNF